MKNEPLTRGLLIDLLQRNELEDIRYSVETIKLPVEPGDKYQRYKAGRISVSLRLKK